MSAEQLQEALRLAEWRARDHNDLETAYNILTAALRTALRADPAPIDVERLALDVGDRISVHRAGLVALLRMVDSGGFWSGDLGITYPAGSDVPVEDYAADIAVEYDRLARENG